MCGGAPKTPKAPDPIPPPPPLPAATPPPPPPKPPAPAPPVQQQMTAPADVQPGVVSKRKKSTRTNSASNRQMLSSPGVNVGGSSPSNGVNI